MISLKSVLKYLIYFFLAGWMFLLGIMVGRGTSPVKFDTRQFQERLESIAREHGSQKSKVPEKVDLEYYSVLNHPIPTEGNPDASQGVNRQIKTSGEIIPKKEKPGAVRRSSDPAPEKEIVKTSLKKATYKQKAASVQTAAARPPAPVKPKKGVPKTDVRPAVKKKPSAKKENDASEQKGVYTIQVAAYKDLKDAVIEMTRLEKKGFRSYRVETIINGVTWYRVRTGSFATYDQAKAVKEKLKQARIKTMIVKKGS